MRNFLSLEIVCRGSETQLQVGENFNNRAGKVSISGYLSHDTDYADDNHVKSKQGDKILIFNII